MPGYRVLRGGRTRRGSAHRHEPYHNRDQERLPKIRPDHLLQHDGSSQGREVARAREEARVARDWRTFFAKAFERSEITIHHPRHIHLVPNYETLKGKLDEVVMETLKRMQETIDSHLDETATNAEARAENPSNRDQELLIATVATTVEATVKQILERMKLTKESG